MKGVQNETTTSDNDLQKIWDEEVSGEPQASPDDATGEAEAAALAAEIAADNATAEAAEALAAEQAAKAGSKADESNGKNSQPGSTAKPDGKPSVKDDKPPVQKPASSDVLSSLPEDVRQALNAIPSLQKANATMEQNLRAAIGRVAAIQREFDIARKQTPKASEVGGSDNLPSAADVKDASKSLEKWEQLKKDFPDWAEAIEERVSNLKPQQPQRQIDPRALAEFVQMRTQQSVTPLLELVESLQVEIAHKGWKEEILSPEFGSWLNGQPADVQALADSPKSSDAIALLDKFKAFKSTAPNPQEILRERQQRLNQSVTVRGNAANPVKTKRESEMSPEELWELEAKRQYSQ